MRAVRLQPEHRAALVGSFPQGPHTTPTRNVRADRSLMGGLWKPPTCKWLLMGPQRILLSGSKTQSKRDARNHDWQDPYAWVVFGPFEGESGFGGFCLELPRA